MNIRRTREELESLLCENTDNLKLIADAFDGGDHHVAPVMAVILRNLLHTKGRSIALLHQLGMLERLFFNTASSFDPQNLLETEALIAQEATPDGHRYFAPLDQAMVAEFVPFQDWWRQIVFSIDDGEVFSRESLVLHVADKEGKHVDPKIPSKFAKLKTSPWIPNPETGSDLKNRDRHAILQIVHEVLKTIDNDYAKEPKLCNGMLFHGASVRISNKNQLIRHEKIGRNERCPCGSSLKYKKCCGSTI